MSKRECEGVPMDGVIELGEGHPVHIVTREQSIPGWTNPYTGAVENLPAGDTIVALNEGGYNATVIDLDSLIAWLVRYRGPDVRAALDKLEEGT